MFKKKNWNIANDFSQFHIGYWIKLLFCVLSFWYCFANFSFWCLWFVYEIIIFKLPPTFGSIYFSSRCRDIKRKVEYYSIMTINDHVVFMARQYYILKYKIFVTHHRLRQICFSYTIKALHIKISNFLSDLNLKFLNLLHRLGVGLNKSFDKSCKKFQLFLFVFM